MTFVDFTKEARDVADEKFQGTTFDPIEYAIQRAFFQENKLTRLIDLAQKSSYLTAKRKMHAWERQLERVRNNRKRLQNFQKDLKPPAPLEIKPQSAKGRAVHAAL